jgi:hypothetical protein
VAAEGDLELVQVPAYRYDPLVVEPVQPAGALGRTADPQLIGELLLR